MLYAPHHMLHVNCSACLVGTIVLLCNSFLLHHLPPPLSAGSPCAAPAVNQWTGSGGTAPAPATHCHGRQGSAAAPLLVAGPLAATCCTGCHRNPCTLCRRGAGPLVHTLSPVGTATQSKQPCLMKPMPEKRQAYSCSWTPLLTYYMVCCEGWWYGKGVALQAA